ncbi:MAG: hypothetical protein MSC31_04505 [Solirubrobacteraceae bacterium MAG38_C4-C5]|nr:hypothetical protein [Candidatus Siliceabacter maunaloa]
MALAVAFGAPTLLNYDTLYGLLWGRELAEGSAPDLDVALAPTQHPLLTAAGVALAPLTSAGRPPFGTGDEALVAGGALACLGLVAWLAFALGRAWFGAGAGVVAAALIVTREPILSYGLRAYVDLPYVALVLGALLVETRRPRAGWPVLALLALAGLLRPEAWLFSAAYVGWLWWRARREGAVAGHRARAAPAGEPRGPRAWAGLAALAAAGPVLWALTDLALTGNPLFSLTETRAGAEELGRITGLENVPETLPRRLGEILRPDGLLAAAGGGVLALYKLRSRTTLLGAAAGALAVAAFCVLAAAGLSILTRYLLLPATILAVFAGAGVLGWRALSADDPWRRPWMAFAVLVAVLVAVVTPSQLDRLGNLRAALERQDAIVADLNALFRPLDPLDSDRAIAIPPGCGPITVPNRRPVPHLALWTGAPAGSFVVAQDEPVPPEGLYLRPSSPEVARDFILDRRDLDRSVPPPAPGLRRAGESTFWTVWGTCPAPPSPEAVR